VLVSPLESDPHPAARASSETAPSAAIVRLGLIEVMNTRGVLPAERLRRFSAARFQLLRQPIHPLPVHAAA
jgi:hypothetical protein